VGTLSIKGQKGEVGRFGILRVNVHLHSGQFYGNLLMHVQTTPLALPSVDPTSLISRKVFTRWPDDNNFYEATITRYNPATVCSKFYCYLLLDADMQLCYVILLTPLSLFRVSMLLSMTWATQMSHGSWSGFVM
jgi:hypothetical protein